jgi:hypothetical protein
VRTFGLGAGGAAASSRRGSDVAEKRFASLAANSSPSAFFFAAASPSAFFFAAASPSSFFAAASPSAFFFAAASLSAFFLAALFSATVPGCSPAATASRLAGVEAAPLRCAGTSVGSGSPGSVTAASA